LPKGDISSCPRNSACLPARRYHILVWATEFPTGVGSSVEDLLALAVEWLAGSPHRPWSQSDIDWAVSEGTTIFEKEGEVVEVARAATEAERWCGLRHTYVEEGEEREWVAAIVGHEDGEGLRVPVRLECNLLVAGLDLPDLAFSPKSSPGGLALRVAILTLRPIGLRERWVGDGTEVVLPSLCHDAPFRPQWGLSGVPALAG